METLDIIQLPAIGIWLIAGLLIAIATVRARVLPIAIWLGFAAGLPAAIALGDARSPALAPLWLAIAVAEPATIPASASQQPQGTDRQRCRQRPATSDHLPGSPLAGRERPRIAHGQHSTRPRPGRAAPTP